MRVLSRWELSGGLWVVVDATDTWITFGLLSCDGGEEMTRVTAARTAVLAAFLAGRSRSDDLAGGGPSLSCP